MKASGTTGSHLDLLPAPTKSSLFNDLPQSSPVAIKKKSKLYRPIALIVAGVGVVSIGLLAWLGFSGSTSDVDQLAAAKSNSLKLESDHSKGNKASEGAVTDLGSASNAQPEIEELTLSNTTTDDVSVVSQASSSIESFMTKLGGNAENIDMDTAVLESVQKMLASKDEPSVAGESLGAPNTTMDSIGEPKAASENPFADLMDDEAAPMTDEANAKVDPATPNSTETLGFVQETWTANRSLTKTTFRVPFRPLEKNAVCRAELKLPEGLLHKPEGTLLLAGKQDVSWTVALEDDSVSLVVYMRSKPARSWYVATAVRAKVNDVEFPLGPTDAQSVVQRLIARNRWLGQQRAMLESMKSNPKMKSGCTEAIREIDKEVKKTDKSLIAWQELASLASAFYKSHKIELCLAEANDRLPALVAEEIKEEKE